MSKKLEPCPCGYGDVVIDDSHENGAVQVVCFKCGRATDWFYGYTHDEWDEALDDAIAAWNAGEHDG